jgi:hypothetical protein
MRGLKRPASDDQPISGPATRSKTARVAIAAPPPTAAEEIVPASPASRLDRNPQSPPYHPEVQQVLPAAEPLHYVSLEEKAKRERDGYKAKYLKGRVKYHNLELQLQNEYQAANLGWRLLWGQKQRITQLESEKTGLLEANRSLTNEVVHLRNGQAYKAALQARDRANGHSISLQLLKSGAEAETRRVKQAAADEKKKLEAEIAELKKKLAAKEESIKKAFLE